MSVSFQSTVARVPPWRAFTLAVGECHGGPALSERLEGFEAAVARRVDHGEDEELAALAVLEEIGAQFLATYAQESEIHCRYSGRGDRDPFAVVADRARAVVRACRDARHALESSRRAEARITRLPHFEPDGAEERRTWRNAGRRVP